MDTPSHSAARWARQVIPEKAVEAAMLALGEQYGDDAHCKEREYVVTILEAAAPHSLVHVHHHDIEHHARSFNQGYEAAVTQGLADDPTLADDWFQEKIREAKAEAWDECERAEYVITLNDDGSAWEPVKTNPYRSQA